MQPVQATMVHIYIDENDRWDRQPLYLAILTLLQEHNVAGATVLRAIAGYGLHKRIHTAELVEIVNPLPLVIEIVDHADRLQPLLPQIQTMVREGVIVEETVAIVHGL